MVLYGSCQLYKVVINNSQYSRVILLRIIVKRPVQPANHPKFSTQGESFKTAKKRKENMSLYIILFKSSPQKSLALFFLLHFSCSFNDSKFILCLKRRRRAEEKLTNRIERKETKKKGFTKIILSDKWKIDDILWFWKIVFYLKIDFFIHKRLYGLRKRRKEEKWIIYSWNFVFSHSNTQFIQFIVLSEM